MSIAAAMRRGDSAPVGQANPLPVEQVNLPSAGQASLPPVYNLPPVGQANLPPVE